MTTLNTVRFLVLSIILASCHTTLLADVVTNGDVEFCTAPVYNNAQDAVGYSYPNASLRVDGGSVLQVPYNLTVGLFSTSSNNTILVTDAGTILTVTNSNYSSITTIGATGPGNSFTLRSGAKVQSGGVLIGNTSAPAQCCGCGFGFTTYGNSVNNTVTITGPNTTWTATGSFDLGLTTGNFLTIANGAHLASASSSFNSSGYQAIVTGSGSRWDISGPLVWNFAAPSSASAQMVVNQGGELSCNSMTIAGTGSGITVADPGSSMSLSQGLTLAGPQHISNFATIINGASASSGGDIYVGYAFLAANNVVTVTGARSQLLCPMNSIFLGNGSSGSGNQLIVTSGGLALATNIAAAGGCSVIVSGTLLVTNVFGTGLLSITGALTNSGNVAVDRLSGSGIFKFPVGSLVARSSSITGGLPFVVGDGAAVARYVMQGGTHSFNNGLVISNNSILSGWGTVNGVVTNYGTINLNSGCDMFFNGLVVNYGKIISAASATPHFSGGLIDHTAARSFPILTSDGGLGTADGQFTFTVAWNAGNVVVVQGSSDLQNWTPIETNTMATPYFQMSIPTTTAPGGTFFRVKSLP